METEETSLWNIAKDIEMNELATEFGLPVNEGSPPPAFFTEAAEVKPRDPEPDDDFSSASLTNEQRKARRLARRPNIDHLEPGVASVPGTKDPVTGLLKAEVFPLFNVGDRIIVERFVSWQLDEWLDTRVYQVREIDDETGFVKCLDVEANHHAVVGFKHPGQTFKLCAQKGDPFQAPKVKNAGAHLPSLTGKPSAPGEKRRGRPPGSKNRPKDVVEAEKAARTEKKK